MEQEYLHRHSVPQIRNFTSQERKDAIISNNPIDILRLDIGSLLLAYYWDEKEAWEIADELITKTAEERFTEIKNLIPEAFEEE